jgi:hypothetical protein
MEKVVSWKALLDLIEPHYPKTSSKGGRSPYPLATMLRIHLLQQWYQGRLKVRHKAAGAAMLVPVLSGLLPSVGRPRCQC